MKVLGFLFIILSFSLSAQDIMLSENFSEGIPSNWVLKTDNERRNWYAKSFKDDNYVQMSAFGGKGKSGYKVVSELHSPLMETDEKSCKLRFSFADAYENGQPLTVLISGEELQPIRSLNDEFWKSLVNNPDHYDNQYEATEWIELPRINQPYRISFVYDSNAKNDIITTIIQLKEVDVWCH